jgi:type I restriction enzyme, S subunit
MNSRLPHGWKEVRLIDVSLDKGQYGSGASAVAYDSKKPRYVRITDIDDNGHLKDGEMKAPSEIEERYFLSYGDFLFARSGSVGRTYLHEKREGHYQYAGYLIRFKLNRKMIIPKYLYYVTKSKSYWVWIEKQQKSVTISNINAPQYAEFSFVLPPFDIQKKIVSILEKAEKLKELRVEADKLTKDFFKAVFLEMFGDPVKNSKRWKVDKLKNHIDLLTGYPFKSKEYTDDKKEIRLCGGLIIMPYGIEWNKANYWKRSLTGGLDRFWLDVGDIVIAMDRPWISSGFKICQIKEDDVPSLLVQRTARIRGKNINQNFLFWLLNHKSFEIHAKPTETTVPHISPKDIQEFEIILPPIELQNEFSKIVESIELMKNYQKQSKEQIENLFNNLMQKVFRGELAC